MTNYERIKAMSVEEMAEFMMRQWEGCPPVNCPPDLLCKKCWAEWLESECDT